MACNAHNHRANCNCGWGGETGGGGFSGTSITSVSITGNRYLGVRSSVSSLIVPNASCFVCGQCVYFYTNDFGSRVFFDSLWPDWDKHPCTDNPKLPVGRVSRPTPVAAASFLPSTTDWIPISFQRRDVEDGWFVLRFHNADGDLIRILINNDVSPRRDSPTYMKPWDDRFQTELEFLGPEFEMRRALGWKYAAYFLETPQSCLADRQDVGN